MSILIAWLLTPLGRIVGMILAAVIVLGSLYIKIRNDGVQAERARIEQENRNAIDRAREARDAARDSFDRDPAGRVPESDYRD